MAIAPTWLDAEGRRTEPTGSVALIHLESHFTDEKAGVLRAEAYRRLRRHWQFINELKLFEIQDQKRYGINVYGSSREPDFLQAASLYHPDTVNRSLEHDGSGTEPGIKDLDGNWDLRPHAGRIVHVTPDTLRAWHAVLETDDVPVEQTRMVYAVNTATAAVLDKLAAAPRIGDLGLQFSRGWDESIDRKKGFFDSEWGVPESWDSVILQGPHLYVATPFYKTPNETMLHHLDWTETDLEALPPDAIPVTSYKPRGARAAYDAAYTHWRTELGDSVTAARDHYRVAWRNMAANTGERTLIPAIIPPRAAHVDGIYSLAILDSAPILVCIAASMSSLLSDFAVRVAPKSTIRSGTASRLPSIAGSAYLRPIMLRTLRLNCVSAAYSDLWSDCFDPEFCTDTWTSAPIPIPADRQVGLVDREWTPATPLRLAVDRRQALLEIDALVALSLGITADELVTIYRTQFPVLYGYDQNAHFYDGNGRLVPSGVLTNWRRKGELLSIEERTVEHPGSGVRYTYALPFRALDREGGLRRAYSAFAERV